MRISFRPPITMALTLAAVAAPLEATAATFSWPGMCDASAVLVVEGGVALVAEDERNTAMAYRLEGDPQPQAVQLGRLLQIEKPKDPDATAPEADLEGMAGVDGKLVFITSHGRNSSGELKPNRQRIMTARLTKNGAAWSVTGAGEVSKTLRTRLAADGRIADSLGDDTDDEDLAPEKQGLNIEGLAGTPDGKGLLIGLRNPLADTKAILVTVPDAAAPDAPIAVSTLDLDGRGIRSIEYDVKHRRYVIVAGSPGDDWRSALFTWSGQPGQEPVLLADAIPKGFNAEGLALDADGSRALLVSDDGEASVEIEQKSECEAKYLVDQNGRLSCPCKRLVTSEKRSFRALWVDVPAS